MPIIWLPNMGTNSTTVKNKNVCQNGIERSVVGTELTKEASSWFEKLLSRARDDNKLASKREYM